MKTSAWKNLSLSLLLALCFPHGAFSDPIPDSLTIQSGSQSLSLSLSELKKKLPTVQVEIKDDGGEVSSTPKKYDTFLLSDVLKLFANASEADEITFHAADGYDPSMPRAKLDSHEGYLAYREHGRPASKGRFEKFRHGKTWISPGPFYLVWKDGKKLGEGYPWPYQLVKIEFFSFKEKFAKAYPATAADSPEMRGFQIFRTSCFRCHSLNLVGGTLGPELNTPKSVLEYWDKNTLRAFIKQVSSFRARDKMPDFPNLKDSDIDDLFAYLSYLSEHRLPADKPADKKD